MNISRVLDDLYVGQRPTDAQFVAELMGIGVTHVLNLLPEPIPGCSSDLDFWDGPFLRIPQEDNGSPRKAEQIVQGIAYYAMVKRAGGALYIHCQFGLGRALAMTYGIMRAVGWTMNDAIRRINVCRKVAEKYEPNWTRYIASIEAAL